MSGPDTLAFDHVHFAAPDRAAATAWYVEHMGARPGAAPDRVIVGGVLLIFYETADAAPSHGGVIDHVGFSFADAEAKIRELAGAGARVIGSLREIAGVFKVGFVEDPFGATLAIVEDRDALGFHHVHTRVPDPDAAFSWYGEMFGGERARFRDRIDGLKYGDVWLFAQQGDSLPSMGRAIDHVAWRTRNLDATAADLRARGVAFTLEPQQFTPAVRISFLDGPAHTRIELLQRS